MAGQRTIVSTGASQLSTSGKAKTDPTDPMTSTGAATEAPASVSLAQAFWYWLKLGFISFGGPAGQVEAVDPVRRTDVERRDGVACRLQA